MFKGSDELQYKNKYISHIRRKMPKQKRLRNFSVSKMISKISGVANSEMQTSQRHRLNWNHF